jgi:hypothetical protein
MAAITLIVRDETTAGRALRALELQPLVPRVRG